MRLGDKTGLTLPTSFQAGYRTGLERVCTLGVPISCAGGYDVRLCH